MDISALVLSQIQFASVSFDIIFPSFTDWLRSEVLHIATGLRKAAPRMPALPSCVGIVSPFFRVLLFLVIGYLAFRGKVEPSAKHHRMERS